MSGYICRPYWPRFDGCGPRTWPVVPDAVCEEILHIPRPAIDEINGEMINEDFCIWKKPLVSHLCLITNCMHLLIYCSTNVLIIDRDQFVFVTANTSWSQSVQSILVGRQMSLSLSNIWLYLRITQTGPMLIDPETQHPAGCWSTTRCSGVCCLRQPRIYFRRRLQTPVGKY